MYRTNSQELNCIREWRGHLTLQRNKEMQYKTRLFHHQCSSTAVHCFIYYPRVTVLVTRTMRTRGTISYQNTGDAYHYYTSELTRNILKIVYVHCPLNIQILCSNLGQKIMGYMKTVYNSIISISIRIYFLCKHLIKLGASYLIHCWHQS
jgi:hypothetical protein